MVPLLVVVALLGGVVAVLSLLAYRVRRRGTGGHVMGPFEELWYPTAHHARVVMEARGDQVAPNTTPTPDDRMDETSRP